MDMIFAAFFTGCVFGAGVSAAVYFAVSRAGEKKLSQAIDEASGRLKMSFSDLSLDALSKTADHMIKLASEKLASERQIGEREMAGHKRLLEARIEGLNGEISRLTDLVNALESRRSAQMGELRTAIDASNASAKELYAVTSGLKDTLSSKQGRGQWGERMAEDILASSGLRLGVNYLRQNTEASGNRPDFTFMLPNKMKLNMDVKFPFENYRRFLEASDGERNAFRQAFIKDVRGHIKAVSGREYINPEEHTVDCVIMFIPNERIYGFIFECDPALMDEAAAKNVLICSPVTVISVLSVIRQAADNFVIEKRARELLQAVGVFRKEWTKYSESLEKIGVHIDRLSAEYRELSVTRAKKLDNSVSRLEALRHAGEIEIKPE